MTSEEQEWKYYMDLSNYIISVIEFLVYIYLSE